MALAEYFRRSAVAASQLLGGFDEDAIRRRVEDVTVGIAFDRRAATSAEGAALLDLTVRVLSRLYPRLDICGPDGEADHLVTLAREVNPLIEVDARGQSDIAVCIGEVGAKVAQQRVYAGSAGSVALLSTSEAQPVGASRLPVGAGVAACLAMSNVFRFVFLGGSKWKPDVNVRYSVLDGAGDYRGEDLNVGDDVALAGAGAIGEAAIWTLSRTPVRGVLHVVDPQTVDLGNLQRYVLATRGDVDASKVAVAARYLTDGLTAEVHPTTWQDFVAANGSQRSSVLVALDSARDRRSVQASLPRWIANAWTQVGDLGLSIHRFGKGACLACLYLAHGAAPSEDQIVAEALGVPDHLLQIRTLLYQHAGAPKELLEVVSQRLAVDFEAVAPYEGTDLRTFYREGICGGTVLPLGRVGSPRGDVHVPLAHQSALAGVLLAASLIGEVAGINPPASTIRRIDTMSPVPPITSPQLVQADPRGICICQDEDYRASYAARYEVGT